MEKTTAAAEPSEPSQQRGSGCGGWQVQVHSFYWRRIQSVVPVDPCRHPSEKTNQPPLRPQLGLSCGKAALASKEFWPGVPWAGLHPHLMKYMRQPARQPSARIGHVSTPAGHSALLDDLHSACSWGRGGHVSSPFLMPREESWYCRSRLTCGSHVRRRCCG